MLAPITPIITRTLTYQPRINASLQVVIPLNNNPFLYLCRLQRVIEAKVLNNLLQIVTKRSFILYSWHNAWHEYKRGYFRFG